MTEQFYHDYFEQIAISLRDIAHNPQGDDERFFFIRNGSDTAPVLDALRNSLTLPALLAEQFDDSITLVNDNYVQQLFGSFYVICQATPTDYAAIDVAKQQARDIARKIHAKMLMDSRQGILEQNNIVLEMELRGHSIDAIGGIGYGWGYDFTWRTPVNLRYDPSDWA